MSQAPSTALGYKLNNNEEVLLNIKPSKRSATYFLATKCWRILFMLAMLTFYTLFEDPTRNIFTPLINHINSKINGLHYWIFFAVIALLVALYFWTKRILSSYNYVITNQRVIIKSGVISKNTRIIAYPQLKNIASHASFLERIFFTESVYLDTASDSLNVYRKRFVNNTFRMEGLSHADTQKVMDTLSQHIVSK